MGGDDSGVRETGALRLFVAVDVPDGVKRSVATAIEPWRQTFPEARWIPPENWHLTLTFLGATARELVPWIEESIGAVASAHAPVEARLTNLGAFPIGGRARVLWVAVNDPVHRLAALAADLEAGLAREFPLEARRFHPHLTVARSEPPVRLPHEFTETTVSAGSFNVEGLVLFRSHLRRPRPRYEAIRFFSLSG